MPRSPLFGRRIHISGSIHTEPSIASAAAVDDARQLVAALVGELVRRGANFVIPVDGEERRGDGRAVCFDWDIWSALYEAIPDRPVDAIAPAAIAVTHHKTEEQVPADRAALWDWLGASAFVHTESAAQWSMNARRMDRQAAFGDILVTLGGDEGVLHLANRYHEAGKPVVPLDLAITPPHRGSRKLFEQAESADESARFFELADGGSAHSRINRLRFPARRSLAERLATIVELLEALAPPRAFGVRLLNPDHDDFAAVDEFFEGVVRPVVEDELGYRLTVIDPRHAHSSARVDEEIFSELARAALVVADLTGDRPNCYLELGFALGRAVPVIVTAKKGGNLPFDVATVSSHLWASGGSLRDRRTLFRDHWTSVRGRAPLVRTQALVR